MNAQDVLSPDICIKPNFSTNEKSTINR